MVDTTNKKSIYECIISKLLEVGIPSLDKLATLIDSGEWHIENIIEDESTRNCFTELLILLCYSCKIEKSINK